MSIDTFALRLNRDTVAGTGFAVLNDRQHRIAIEEARGWLIDCGADDEDVYDATARAIIAAVDREYEGGASQFVRDIRALF